jgi:tRNA G37 N-methylase Trm5
MDHGTDNVMFVVVARDDGATAHAVLKRQGWLDKRVEPIEVSEDTIGFPVVVSVPQERLESAMKAPFEVVERPAVIRPPVDPHERLNAVVVGWVSRFAADHQAVLDHLPVKWEKLGDLVLLPAESMRHTAWDGVRQHEHAPTLWKQMAHALQADALGVQHPIASDTLRSSQVEMLLGSSNVRFLDHGVTFAFDAAKVMFSSGNNTERRRIGDLDMTGETVVDAYAGVGYYTLPMLVRSRADRVHACELNPDSINGLLEGAALNGVADRLTVHEGDNAETLVKLRGVADRCHLGLLPSSEAVWEACLLALKPSGGTLHVHMNVEEERLDSWCSATVERFRNLVEHHALAFEVTVSHLEKVKWFAPRVRHVVLDLRFRPEASLTGERPLPPAPSPLP